MANQLEVSQETVVLSLDLLKIKYRQLLGYIAELDRLRTTTVHTVSGHLVAVDLSDLPIHPNVVWEPSNPTEFLIVTRCETPFSPALPEVLTGWVDYTPNQVRVEPSRRERVVRDEQEVKWEEAGLSEPWDRWFATWTEWAERARPIFQARDLYFKLYDLHATVERSPEQVELVAADVMVAKGTVDHPILINPVRLEFEVERSTFKLGCSDEPTQIYGDAIREIMPEAGKSIADARKEVSENPGIWSFGTEEVNRFAARFVQGADSDGAFIEGAPTLERLTARRHPWLILRRRATGLAELAEGLIGKFETDGLVPNPIQPVLVDREEEGGTDYDFRGEPDEDLNSYFTKPANAEQLSILRHYRRRGSVHVQGPPGTGKTHTIANLIGHFLAEGKSVLVTSERSQALTVLREKVVEELRPLCVSLVDSDAGEGLKAGMRGLYERLSSTDPSRLANDIDRLTAARARTIADLHRARQAMRDIIENEHRPIAIRGWRGSPAAAGRYVNERRATDGWIPGDVVPDSETPVSQSEYRELLSLLSEYSDDFLPEVRKFLPPKSEVPTPDEFWKLLEEIKAVSTQMLSQPAVKIPRLTFAGGVPQAEQLLEDARSAVVNVKSLDGSLMELANQTVETPSVLTEWENWRATAAEILEKERRVRSDAAPYDFSFTGELDSILIGAKRLLDHVKKTGRPVHKPRMLHSSDKIVFGSVSRKRQIGDEQSLRALIQCLEFEDERDRFRQRVFKAAASVGINDLVRTEPERSLVRNSSLEIALFWKPTEFDPLDSRLAAVGLGFGQYKASLPADPAIGGPVERRVRWLEQVVIPALEQHLHSERLNDLLAKKQEIVDRAQSWKSGDPSQSLTALADALISDNLTAYSDAFSKLENLRAAAEPVQRRDDLLGRIRVSAEGFAASLENGSFEFMQSHGSLDGAWTYALIDRELERRNSLSLEATKDELDRLKRELDQTTIRLADALAWAAQHRRVTQPVRSALSRFHESQRRVGGGKSKRASEFLREMRNAMRDAKDAFPVWIMPLYDVAKSFDFTKTRFDVVIVDESSQLSAVGLITLLIADTAIVVGDDEQTEPSLVGVQVESIKGLINEHLIDFNDRILWSPDSSLYSFAGRFGSTVALREHFRCVPQIISFSSRLCYQSKIQALRESTGVVQLPHVVQIGCKPDASRGTRDLNEAEALEIASLLIACSEQPEYRDQTFGVISLRGSANIGGSDHQTSRVAELLQSALGASDYEQLVSKSRLKFGVPPAFQGDERDVVFVSVGDVPRLGSDGRTAPLSMLSGDTLPGGQYKKRLNVAVSRARNQVWIVHSFAHFEAELKDGDVRRKLLEFAHAPDQWLESTRAVNPKAESPFEEAVYGDLVRRGFKVTPQVPVGHYRIDLVAEDEDSRVAIECDGDAYHQDAAADLSRQIVLERCGWKFVRIRGSEYYRNPEIAINRVVRELEKLGVVPYHKQPEQTEPDEPLYNVVRRRAHEIRAEILAGNQIKLGAPFKTSLVPTPAQERVNGVGESQANVDDSDLEYDDQIEVTAHRFAAEGLSREGSTADARESGTPPVVRGFLIDAEEYIAFTETGYADPKHIGADEIQKSLVKIVRMEGPVTEATVIDRYRVATGYGRFKGPTRDLVVDALRTAIYKGLLNARPDFEGSDVILYTLPGEPHVRFRTRGPRDLHDVPMDEIAILASLLLRANIASDYEDLFRLMLEFYGLKRLTVQTEDRLRKALEFST